jgi:mRNA-degrading endonuclease toxin of MazEF toxin-antitoxin module
MADYPKQGEIWWASFFEGGERPALVVSRNELNRGRFILVVPCTSSQVERRAVYRNHVLLPSGSGGLTSDTIAQTHLIQPIEVGYLERKLGELDTEQLAEVLLAIAWTIDLFDTAQSS